jgi:hypothetical protein
MKTYTQKAIIEAFRNTFQNRPNLWVQGKLETFGNYLKKVEVIQAGVIVFDQNTQTYIKLQNTMTKDEMITAGLRPLRPIEIGPEWSKA